MKITDVPFAVLRFQYQLVRFPLQVIEDRVVARMDSEARARLFYERSLGMLDTAVGSTLDDPEAAKRGTALIERTDALNRAAELDATADDKIRQANTDVTTTRKKVADDLEDARQAKQRDVKAARKGAQARKREAVESAEERMAAGMKHADEVAAQRKSDAEAVERGELAGVRAAEESAAAEAVAKAQDAQQKRDTAESKRAQADRLEDVAETEKRV